MTELTTEQQNEIAASERYLNAAKVFEITDIHTFKEASVMLQEIKFKKKEYDDLRKKLKAPILEAGKNIEEMFRKPLHFLYQAEKAYKINMLKYDKAQSAISDADKRAKMQLEVELQGEATIAYAKGNTDRYENKLAQLSELQSEVIVPQKVEGISFRDNWKGEVTSLAQLIQAVSEGFAPQSLLKCDDSALNTLAKSTKGTMRYPGIRFYNDRIVASRS
jgi:hypothetical protein